MGNGEQIDCWTDRGIQNDRVEDPVPHNSSIIFVKDLFVENRKDWNLDLIDSLFDVVTAQSIKEIPLRDHFDEDKMVWAISLRGETFSQPLKICRILLLAIKVCYQTSINQL